MLALSWCFKYLTPSESTHCLVYFSEASCCKYNGALNNIMTVHKKNVTVTNARIFRTKKKVEPMA